MYSLIPYKRFSIKTELTPEEAVAVLTQRIKPRIRWYPLMIGGGGGFEGWVKLRNFSINRAIDYRNSFLPIMHGRFRPQEGGTEIRVMMFPSVLVLVLWGFFIVLALAGISQVIVGLIGGVNISGRHLTPFGLLLFLYLMCFVGFGVEANKAVQFIRKVFTPLKN